MMISWMMTKADYAGEVLRADSRPYPLSPIPSHFILCLSYAAIYTALVDAARFMES